MKSKILTFLIGALAAILLVAGAASAQKRKPAKAVKALPKATPKPVEVEDWKEFDAVSVKVKLLFPKVPTETVSADGEIIPDDPDAIKSTIVQSEINTDFYLLEVREYREGFIPDRSDLAIFFGEWFRKVILRRSNVISEKQFKYGEYSMVEFVYQDVDSELVIHRAMVSGKKLFQMMIHFEKKPKVTNDEFLEANKGRIMKFFMSFEPYDDISTKGTIGIFRAALPNLRNGK